jgi:hypothetical protein
VAEAHDVIDIRVLRQQFGLDARDRVLHHVRDALHGRRDREDIARADRAVRVAIALEREALERRLVRRLDRRDGQIVQLGRRRHARDVLVHPASLRQRFGRIADHHVVADHRVAFREILQRDLVALRHALAQHEAIGKRGAFAETAVVDDDRDVVVRMDANIERGLIHSDESLSERHPRGCGWSYVILQHRRSQRVSIYPYPLITLALTRCLTSRCVVR